MVMLVGTRAVTGALGPIAGHGPPTGRDDSLEAGQLRVQYVGG